MQSVAVDSNVLYALFDSTDRAHRQSGDFLSNARWPLITTVAVLTEVTYLLRMSNDNQCAFLRWAHTSLSIDQQTADDLVRIADIMAKYADLPADFADATLLALCERTGIEHIATLDSDFDVYWLANGKPLVNVFAGP